MSSASSDRQVPSPSEKATGTTITSRQAASLVWFAVFAIAAVVALTLILAFHYETASDATSVLGEVVPIFTAVIGVLVGGGAGVATGSAGKQTVQSKLTASTAKVMSARSELDALDVAVTQAFETIKQNLISRSGSLKLFAGVQSDDEPIADLGDMDSITSTIAHLKGILDA